MWQLQLFWGLLEVINELINWALIPINIASILSLRNEFRLDALAHALFRNYLRLRYKSTENFREKSSV
ncbi:MAG: hypothetical protein D3909_19050 [Candidatus Electrothrix sp. ATG1]|nr:hypothetical protein [Candidatus Electrothrix sp. ATG1]